MHRTDDVQMHASVLEVARDAALLAGLAIRVVDGAELDVSGRLCSCGRRSAHTTLRAGHGVQLDRVSHLAGSGLHTNHQTRASFETLVGEGEVCLLEQT